MNVKGAIGLPGYYYLTIVAALLLAVTLIVWHGEELRYQDEKDYYALAENIAAGNGFVAGNGEPTASRPPLYPAVIALCVYLGGGIVTAKLANVCFLLIAIVVYTSVANRIIQGAGNYIPLMFLAYPVFIYTSSTLYAQTFGLMMVGLILWILSRKIGEVEAAVTGALSGVLVLAIPGFMLCIPVIGGGVLFLSQAGHYRKMIMLAIYTAASMAIVSVWTARNYYHFHAFVPVSSNSGVNLLLGNSENADSNSGVNADISYYEMQASGMGEIEKDKYYRDSAVQWIKNNPDKAITLYISKVGNYFNYQLNLATKNQESMSKNLIIFFTYYPMLLIALGGLIRNIRLTNYEKFLIIFYFSSALTSAVFFTRIRFRIPFDGVLALMAACSICFYINSFKKNNERK